MDKQGMKFRDTGERKFWEDIVARSISLMIVKSVEADPETFDKTFELIVNNIPLLADCMVERKRLREPEGGTKG